MSLLLLVSETITKGAFPDNLKLADNKPLFKKDDLFDKKNYRHVRVLPTLSDIYEKLMERQISPNLCGYRKDYNNQQALVSLREKWKKIVDDKGFGDALLMGWSKFWMP